MNSTFDQKKYGVHEIFQKNATLYPDKTAVICYNKKITYAELNHAANCAASLLINKYNVNPRTYVPILLKRSPELVISILAVLKTGAAYTLLDETWPEKRLVSIIETLNAPLLITKNVYNNVFKQEIWVPSLELLEGKHDFIPIRVDEQSPCTIFFTSGTTGDPKGVFSPHCGTTRLYHNNSFANFSTNTIIPLAAALPWDAFSLELWGVLLNGGACCIIDEPYLSSEALRNSIYTNKLDTTWITSSLFNMIIEEDPKAFTGLKQVITGGERLSVSHVKKFLHYHPTITLINGYGPVEGTIFATTHRIKLADCIETHGIPIGTPVNGTQVYIIKNNCILKEGEIGEICITGDGLALEYLNDPILTQEKFAYLNIKGKLTRVYHTGDLGSFKKGILYFQGREDRQVKIRGHRIELEEVERQIEKLSSAVKSCRVIVRKNKGGAAHELIAFCIPVVKSDKLNSILELLKSKLVDYQCPSRVIAVEAFPLTPQGKLDENKLLSISKTAEKMAFTKSQKTEIADRSITRIVEDIFVEVLKKEFIPVDVSCLELGGTSLDIGRIGARLSKRLGQVVPVSLIYQYPTVQSLASKLQKAEMKTTQPLTTGKLEGVPLSSMQLVYLTSYFIDSTNLKAHCFMFWLIEGDLNLKLLQSAIDFVHLRHECLRAKYVSDPTPLMYLTDIEPPLLKVLLKQRSLRTAVNALRQELSKKLEIDKGNIWRTAIVPLAESKGFVLGIVVHHIAFDGWSESVLATDLSIGYNVQHDKKSLASITTPLTLVDSYNLETTWLSQTNISKHDVFLIKELAEAPPIAWPKSKKAVWNNDFRVVKERSFFIPNTVLFEVDKLALLLGSATRFEILLSCWARALHNITGQDDFCIGIPIRQRWTPELESALGCYINMACIRIRDKALTPDLKGLHEINRITRRMFTMQEVPFSYILDLLKPRYNGRPLLFQTLFAFQDNPLPSLHLVRTQSKFLRQKYLDLPLELHGEVWQEDGGVRLAVSYDPQLLSEEIIQDLLQQFQYHLQISLNIIKKTHHSDNSVDINVQ